MEDQNLTQCGEKRSFKEAIMRTRYVGKLAAVALLAMLLLIPLGMIQDQIAQRGRYQKRVTEEIA
ncbi:MAG: inner membrane CreD family protein, partial [Candidatus Accumulibacter sp.]|nr:inner membrane CreD family protein [Accumulibacter sp.]